jgi:serine/threonine protein kinase/tetratricopeptide (TPR) repeat protein
VSSSGPLQGPTPPGSRPTEIWNPDDLPPVDAGSSSDAGGTLVDPLIGTLLRGRWRVLARMGAGSFGTVYKVQDEKGGWIEALKILRVDRLAGAEAENMRRRFLREAQIVKRLGSASPHIVGLSTYEEDIEAGLIYFLMEHVDGRVLSQVLHDDGPFPAERAVRVGLQVCEALIAAHESPEPVVHRDLKLENLMLTTEHGEEMVKVLDFGIAKMKAGEADSRLTPTGALGTPGYAAPEQIRAGPVDARTDLFAFGVILYALLTGRDPWLGHLAYEPTNQTYELMSRTDRGEVKPFEELGVFVPAELAEIVYRLVKRDPNLRFQSARELRDALRHVDATESGSASADSTASPGKTVGPRTGPITGDVSSRRLAAVWFADLVGYSSLSSTDEELALTLLQIFHATAGSVVPEGGGRVVQFIGDAVFVEFQSTQQAVRTAMAFRTAFGEATREVHPKARLRIGVHVGDVTAGVDGDLFGDGVNVASRIQNQAEPGQIVVSQDVWRQLKQRRGYAFVSLGERRLKGITAPVWLFSVEDNPTTPGSTGPLLSAEPRPRKSRVASVVQAALAFTAASAVILLSTDFMVRRFGLGAWVLPGAAILLAIGLVIVLRTARVQSRETWERPVSEQAPWELDVPDLLESVAKRRVPHLTWARALVGGAMAFALLFGAAWAYMGMRDVPLPPRATPAAVSGGPLPGLVILPLAAGPADTLGRAVSDLLALSLDGVGGQRVIHAQVVAAHLGAAGPGRARGVGAALGARYAASGTLSRGPDGVAVAMDVFDVGSGTALGSARAAAPADSLRSLVATLAAGILGAESSGARKTPSPRELSTSREALRAYVDGETELRRADWPAAITAFERARAADASFAPALARLSLARSWAVIPHEATHDPDAERALALASALPERQRMMVQGLLDVDRGSEDGVAVLQRLSSQYPDDPEGWFLLGEALRRLSTGPDAMAESQEAFAKAIELAPSFAPAYMRLVPDALARGDTTEARTLLAGYRSAQPTSPLLAGFDDALVRAVTPGPRPTAPPAEASGSPTDRTSADERAQYARLASAVSRSRNQVERGLSPTLGDRMTRADSLWRAAQADAGRQRWKEAVGALNAAGPLYEQLALDNETLRGVDSARAALDPLRPGSRDPDLTRRGQQMERDAERAVAEARYADALTLLGQAADAYRQGARAQPPEAPPSAGASGSTAAPAPVKPQPQAPPEPAPIQPAAVAAQVLVTLRQAMEAEDLARVRRVWTSIGADEADGLKKLFDSVRDLVVQYDVQSTEARGDRIVVTVRTTYKFLADRSHPITQETGQVFELEQAGSGWVIVASRSGS